MKLVGFGDGSYERDGTRVEGYRFYFTYESEKVAGIACYSAWCNKKVGDGFLRCFNSPDQALGEDYELIYNRWGKVAGFQPVQTAASTRK